MEVEPVRFYALRLLEFDLPEDAADELEVEVRLAATDPETFLGGAVKTLELDRSENGGTFYFVARKPYDHAFVFLVLRTAKGNLGILDFVHLGGAQA